MIQIAFSAKPKVSPVFLATRAKGRLQYALRVAGRPEEFSRKLAVRSIGDNRTDQVKRTLPRKSTKNCSPTSDWSAP